MIVIDFAPGQHGHFLEYVVNNYIFKINAIVGDLFQQSGAVHNININSEYQAKKIVTCGHFSSANYMWPEETEKIIRIKRDPKLDFVLLTNIYHRCHPLAAKGHDLHTDVIKKLHSDAMFKSSATLTDLRNNWFCKLDENHLDTSNSKFETNLPTFNFEFGSFFCLEKFIEELQKLANFLNMTFEYNRSFVDLYQKFIEVNQGYQQYQKASKIINNIVNNCWSSIDHDDWQIQAYINLRLSKLFRMYNESWQCTEHYPSNTQEIHQLILQFVQDYDNQF